MDFDDSLAGLRAAIGCVPSDHPLAREWAFSPDFVRAVDARYRSVFLNPRFCAHASRLDRLRRDLSSVERFAPADAEVQAAATILRVPSATIVAEAEGGARRSDYLVQHDREVEVEVRVLQDRASDEQLRAAQARLTERLESAALPPELLLTLQVVSLTTPGSETHALDGRAERALVIAVRRAADAEPWRTRPVFVTLHADGDAEVCHPLSYRDDELASVELRALPKARRARVMAYGGLQALTEADRVEAALKKKSERKQRSGERPWVVVLDASDSRLRDFAEMAEGAAKRFRASAGNLSAVVIQVLSLRALTGGIAISLDDVWASTFQSGVILNPNAKLPLTEREAELFTHGSSTRAELGRGPVGAP
jgi:hypothetical protein